MHAQPQKATAMSKTNDKAWIDPRNAKPQQAGALFLIGPLPDGEDAEPLPGAPVYKTVFLRVRVVMGQVHVADLSTVQKLVQYLQQHKVPFVTFSAGRDLPFPEYEADLVEALETSPRFPGAKVN